MSLKQKVAWLALCCISTSAWSFAPYTIEDIRVEGLQRIEAGTVFNYLPLNVGENLDESRAAEAVRALFKTGFFADVSLQREGGILVVQVEERPSIAKVTLTGNKDIRSEELEDGLKRIGLAEGQVFNRSLLEQVERELERQYFARGKYGMSIASEVKPLERNRVEVDLRISEGKVAKISKIAVVGNKAYDDAVLLGAFQLSPPTFFSFFSQNDQYSKQKLSADLESLRSFYLDRGYVDFNIESTQVAITPDKRDVFITININEGEQYSIEEVKLAGDLIVPEEELTTLVSVKGGDIFSRREVTESANRISERLGKEGYAFANINPAPDVNREARTVALTYMVDPGKRVYVQRVNVAGNVRTRDEVLRREIRQMEGAWIATDSVNRSRVRLQRLGFFEEVNVETPLVPGSEDQVDVNYGVKERSSFGSLMAGVGFSQSQGVMLNASVTQDNFLGTGKRVSAAVNTSRVNTLYSFAFTNPYYTLDGVSRGFRVFSKSTDAGQADVADYTADSYGASVNYSVPVNEYDTFRYSLGYEHNKIKTTSSTPLAYSSYLAENGNEFDVFKLTTGWTHDTRNRAFFPDDGWMESLSAEVAVPGSDLNYYKLSSRTTWYQAIAKKLTLSVDGEIAYGNSYKDTKGFPFFENYYAGGIQSVRGYRAGSLGPEENANSLGGAFKTIASVELFFPPPLLGESNSFRMGVFYDIGNVYAGIDDFDAGQLRYSTGVSAVWLSPIGPLTFAIAKALNDKPGDETQTIQFSLGAVF